MSMRPSRAILLQIQRKYLVTLGISSQYTAPSVSRVINLILDQYILLEQWDPKTMAGCRASHHPNRK